MKNLLNDLKSKLREQPERRRIVFPEARFDPRVAQAVASLAEEQLVVPQVLCSLDELRQLEGVDTDALTSAVDSSALQVLDISDELRQQAEELYATRRAKEGKSPEQVRELMRNPIMLAAALVALGEADGLVAGAATATADVLRASLKLIGLSEGIRTMSSCFIMVLDNPQWGDGGVMLFGDCAVNPAPDAAALVDIAQATVQTSTQLGLLTEPRVAFLSFATHESAKHERVDAVKAAFEQFRQVMPDVAADGPLQADAALVETVRQKKAPGSTLNANANILIFPDLNSGNIGYKLVQRMTGAQAIGPILQGFAKPVSDLSRGCTASEIADVAVITALMA